MNLLMLTAVEVSEEKVCDHESGEFFHRVHQGIQECMTPYTLGKEGQWVDRYCLGGHWPFLLLVKESCMEYDAGRKSQVYRGDEPAVPKGYVWASAARKKDIEWGVLRGLNNWTAAQRFARMERFFQTGEGAPNIPVRVAEDGIVYGSSYLYRKGETLEENLQRHGFPDSFRYPIYAHGFINHDGWQTKFDLPFRGGEKEEESAWRPVLWDYLDSIPDEQVITVLDCHMGNNQK